MASKMERFHWVFGIAGFGMFLMAFLVSGLAPWIAYQNQTKDMVTVEELAASPEGSAFELLANRFPDEFSEYWPDGATPANYADALDMGRDIYIAEGCWHCHSQQVRPVGNEELRYGAPSTLLEQDHELMLPQLLGTRRVGPDLSREGGKRTNGWHIAHFYNPRDVVPNSIMPRYPWFFEEKGVPNKRGFALITYIQWLGTYQPAAAPTE